MSNERRLTALAYACLLLFGLHAGWIGPFLAQISHALIVPIDDAGLVVSAASAGYFVSLLITGSLSYRYSAQRILVVAMAAFGAGLLGLAVAGRLSVLLWAAVLLGISNGAIDVAANALIVDLNRERLTAALNYLHMLFGVGALMGPLIVGFALAWTIPYWWIFALGGLACIAVSSSLMRSPALEIRVPSTPGGFMPIFRHPLIWVLGGMLFLYVGGEMGIGAWLFLYLRTAASLSATISSWGVSFYWLGLIVGRIVAGRLAHRSAPREVTIFASALSAIALLALIAMPMSHAIAAAAVFLIGFGYGPVFPNMIAIGAAHYPSQVGRMSSIVIAGGALGGVFVPWLMGRAMAVSTPGASMTFALAVTILMALLALAIRAQDDRVA